MGWWETPKPWGGASMLGTQCGVRNRWHGCTTGCGVASATFLWVARCEYAAAVHKRMHFMWENWFMRYLKQTPLLWLCFVSSVIRSSANAVWEWNYSEPCRMLWFDFNYFQIFHGLVPGFYLGTFNQSQTTKPAKPSKDDLSTFRILVSENYIRLLSWSNYAQISGTNWIIPACCRVGGGSYNNLTWPHCKVATFWESKKTWSNVTQVWIWFGLMFFFWCFNVILSLLY